MHLSEQNALASAHPRAKRVFGGNLRIDVLGRVRSTGLSATPIGSILSVGLPIGVILFTETMLFTGSTMLIGRLGPVQLAAHGVTLLLLNIALMAPVGISHAAVSRVAFLRGRGARAAVWKAARASVVVAGLVGAALALPSWWRPAPS